MKSSTYYFIEENSSMITYVNYIDNYTDLQFMQVKDVHNKFGWWHLTKHLLMFNVQYLTFTFTWGEHITAQC